MLCCYNHSLEQHARFTAAKWLTNDQEFVVVNCLGELTFWSKTKGYVKTLQIFDKVNDMVVLPGGDILLASVRGKLFLVACNSHQVACSFTAHTDSVLAIDVDKTGNFIVTGSCDKSIKTWEVIRPDGHRSLKPVYERKDAHKFEVTAVTFGVSQEITYSGSVDNVVVEWDMETGKRRREFRCSSLGWRVICISIIDTRLFACFQDSSARVWSLLDGALVMQLVGRGGRYHVAQVLPESNQAFSDGSHFTLQHWRLKDGRLLTSFEGHTDEVTSLCLLPGGQHLITGSRDKTLKLWRISDGGLETEFFFEQAVLAVACSSKGHVVVGLGNGQLCFIHIN